LRCRYRQFGSAPEALATLGGDRVHQRRRQGIVWLERATGKIRNAGLHAMIHGRVDTNRF
jgi:hypothetical protein